MAKFRHKPLVVEAVQWFEPGDHPAVTEYRPTGITAMLFPLGAPLLRTAKGMFPVTPGDWIVTARDGTYSLYPPDRFEVTYEPADWPYYLLALPARSQARGPDTDCQGQRTEPVPEV